jgi:cobalt/nickel transport system permease protein
MINFPVLGGTSGHLIGGTLAAVLLGPSAAVLVLTAVLLVQCFLFADGGVLALGANVTCMAIVDAMTGYAVYRAVHRLIPGDRGRLAAVAFGAWCGTVVASVVCAGMLAMSGTLSARVVLPAMVNVHLLIGVGEAVITMLAVAAVWRARPELLELESARRRRATRRANDARPANDTLDYAPPVPVASGGGLREFVAYGLLVALAIAVFASPFASTAPDGLEKVAQTHGFADRAAPQPLVAAPVPDYAVPGIGRAGVATAVAGLLGTVVVFALSLVVARVVVPRRPVGFDEAMPEPVAGADS